MIEVKSLRGIRQLVLSRPERGNALSAELVEGLIEAVAAAESDPDAHTIVFGTSGKNFCTGFDLGSIEVETDAALLHRFVRIEMLLAAVWHSHLRTVACARGKTWGAGADLFTACSIRVCGPDTSFRFPGARFGLVLGTRRLAERVGTDLARRLVAEDIILDAAGAVASGLASEVRTDLSTDYLQSSPAPLIDSQTAAFLSSATRADHRDADLALLVRSAVTAGLKERMVGYRDASRAAAERRRR